MFLNIVAYTFLFVAQQQKLILHLGHNSKIHFFKDLRSLEQTFHFNKKQTQYSRKEQTSPPYKRPSSPTTHILMVKMISQLLITAQNIH